jgi:hypothetical protein
MDTGDVNNQPAIRLWFPSGQKPRKSDFRDTKMVCEFWTLWQAVEDVGQATREEISRTPAPHGSNVATLYWKKAPFS